MKQLSLFLGSVMLIFAGCQKVDYDSSPVNDPVFFVSYEKSGVQETFVAGDDNLYMHTSLGVSNEGVPMAIGELGPLIPAQKGPSWRMHFLSPNKNVFSMDALLPGQRTLYSQFNIRRTGSDFSLRFIPQPADSLNVSEYIWRIDAQGTTFTATENPIVTIDDAITPVITVTLTIIYQNQCRDDIRHVIDFSNIMARSDFQIGQTANMTYHFNRNDPREVANDSIVWLINNAVQTNGPLFSHTFGQTGQYQVTMRTHWGDGHTSETTREVFVNNQMNSRCHSNFTFELTPAGGLDFFQKNRVYIAYTDSIGNTYSSKPIDSQQMISLGGYEYFHVNQNRQTTAAIEVSGDFELEDTNGNTISIKDFEGVFGVAVSN